MKIPEIYEILNKYRVEHPEYMAYTDTGLLQVIFDNSPDLLKGIPQAEIDAIMKGSIFGTGFNTDNYIDFTTIDKIKNVKRDSKIKNQPVEQLEQIHEIVVDNVFMNNMYSHIQENEPEELNPYQDALITLFYLSNKDILQDMTKYMTSREITDGHDFEDLESAAEFILKKQGKECSDDNIAKLAKELIILNSNGNETDFDSMVNNALGNINKGCIRFINREFDIIENGVLTKDLNDSGFEFNDENQPIFQMLHIFEKDSLDGTCSEIEKRLNEFFNNDCEDKSINELYNELKEMLSNYKGSLLAENLLNNVEILKNNNIKDINEWKSLINTREYKKQQNDVQNLFFKYASKKISLNKLKETMLTKYGFNMYAKQEQDKAKEIQLQNSTATLVSNIYKYRGSACQNAYDNYGPFYNLYNKIMERVDDIAKIFGGNVYTNLDHIQFLNESSDFWQECTPEKMSYTQFKQTFESAFKEFDEDAARNLLEYLAYNPDIDILNDVHREFLDKFEAVFGRDFLKNVLDDGSMLDSHGVATGIGNLLILTVAMEYIAKSKAMEGISFNSSTLYRALGLTGKGLKLATGMTVGGTTFASYTLITQMLDNIIMERGVDDWAKLPGQVGESFAFGAFAAAVNILLISPMTSPQFKEGLETAENLVNEKGAAAGDEFIKTIYEGQAPVIKSDAGKFLYSIGVNTLAFTAYGVGEDLIKNGTEPLKEENFAKYIGDLVLANLANILTFEGLQILIGGSIAGKTGAESAKKMTAEEITQYFESLKKISVEKSTLTPDMRYKQGKLNEAEPVKVNFDNQKGNLVTLSDGSVAEYVSNAITYSSSTGDLKEVYILSFPEGKIVVNSISEAYSIMLEIMMREIQYKKMLQNMPADNIQGTDDMQLQPENAVADAVKIQQTEPS